jgi:acyl-CoA thioester hydrolase
MAIVSQRIRHREGEKSLARTELAAVPFRSSEMAVEDGWIDYNGHLNMAYYNVLFDRAIDQFLEALGIGPTYVKARNATMFALEAHISYLRELKAGDRVVVDTHILDHDAKRAHLFQTLIHAGGGFAAATSEQAAVHVDLTSRKSAPFPPDRLEVLSAMAARHAKLPRPEQAGRSIGLHKRKTKRSR